MDKLTKIWAVLLILTLICFYIAIELTDNMLQITFIFMAIILAYGAGVCSVLLENLRVRK